MKLDQSSQRKGAPRYRFDQDGCHNPAICTQTRHHKQRRGDQQKVPLYFKFCACRTYCRRCCCCCCQFQMYMYQNSLALVLENVAGPSDLASCTQGCHFHEIVGIADREVRFSLVGHIGVGFLLCVLCVYNVGSLTVQVLEKRR